MEGGYSVNGEYLGSENKVEIGTCHKERAVEGEKRHDKGLLLEVKLDDNEMMEIVWIKSIANLKCSGTDENANIGVSLVPYPLSPEGSSDVESEDDVPQTTISSIQQQETEVGASRPVHPETGVNTMMPCSFMLMKKSCFDAIINKSFNSIYHEVWIPKDLEFSDALSILEMVKKIMRNDGYPHCEVYMFRYWYLKLKHDGTNELLLFVDCADALSSEKKFAPKLLTDQKIREILRSSKNTHQIHRKRFQNDGCGTMGTTYLHGPSNLEFCVVVDPKFALECQTCRVLKYLCHFDSRVCPLISLVTCWAKVNNVKFSMANFKTGVPPGPAALEWLVMFFCVSKNMIPTPRKVASHVIGFTFDDDWVKQWSDDKAKETGLFWGLDKIKEIIISVLGLAKELFYFYSKLSQDEDSWILNTRDGECLPKKRFLYRPYELGYTTKLSIEETMIIQEQENVQNPTLDLKQQIILLHPLDIRVGISLNSKAITEHRSTMETTANRISEFLRIYEKIENWENINMMKDLLVVHK